MRGIFRPFIPVLLICVCAYSQEGLAPTRPKVGLVLEGGSALGLAHVGVLRWLEEHHVPINYIAGTSMGGLVGGVYSTGKTTAELQQLLQTIDWDAAVQGHTPYEDLSFRRKEDAFEYPNRLEFGLRKGLQFPEGFNSGQQVTLILDRAALPYFDIADFNQLPTPFACVATDLVTSKKFVFRDGSLSLALRSTMSLPGLFTPVRWEGHIFADGGLLDNLPVDVAKEMGADITIAVHLQVAPLEPAASLSSFGVLGKAMSVVVAANELQSMEKADVLISVPVHQYGSLDFAAFQELSKAGYDAAEAKSEILRKFAVDDSTWQAYVAARAARRRSPPVPDFVKVVGTKPFLVKAIEEDLQNNVGKPIDPVALDKELMAVKGEERFANLSYQMTGRGDNDPGLLVTATEKSYAPPTVQPLLLFEGANFGGVNFSLGARITFQDFGSYRTELRNDIMVGTQYRFASQYYHPLSTTSNWFIAPNISAEYLQYPIYNKADFLAQYKKTSIGGGLNVGYEFNKVAQLTLGYTAAYQTFAPKIGDTSLLPNVSGRYGATTLRWFLNEVSNPVIPRSGQYAIVSGTWLDASPGAAHSYPLAEVQLTKFVPVDAPSTVYFGARGGTTFGNTLVGVPPFSLGGGNGFNAYGQNELLTSQYYLFQAGYLRKLAKLPVLLGESVYLNAVAEVGKTFAPPFTSQVPGDAAVALVINTIFGPVEIGGAAGATGHHRIFFKLGRIF